MSLIYQALKQNEQQAPVTVVVGAPSPAAPPAVVAPAPSAAGWMRRSMLLGGLLLGGGVLAGLLLGQRSGSAPSPVPAPAPAASVAPPAAVAVVEPPPLPKAAVVAAAPASVPAPAPTLVPAPAVAPVAAVANPQAVALPKAEPPLPTVGPRLTLSTTLSAQPVPATAPEPKAAPATRPANVEVSVKSGNPVPEPAGTAGMDVAELFDGLNRALDTRDEATASRNIQAIRVRLPESSLARMRAEGWYAFRNGDLEKAQRFYRRLLDKLPGDENASLALASIERQEQRPDQAREVLSRSLKANPGSTVLRSALDQSPNEASR
ncbi:tetratricopeptide repeat protein [Hydrogenophaga sp. RWCD_12]|uniref:tetratricopeptide repeat protein n=1 Tax=Hydrogenophaga sp. RWCD_12 TaxID=3391190 RepID=UPI0039850065